MDDEAWRRHANLWSVWTRFAASPALVVPGLDWLVGARPACRGGRVPAGEPARLPAVPASRGWASKGVHGEALWFRHPERVPPRHRAALRWPTLPAAAGSATLCRGLARLSRWPAVSGAAAVAAAQLWRLHLLGRLHDEGVRPGPADPGA